MSEYLETSAPTAAAVEGDVWLSVTYGDGTGDHDVADLVLHGGGGRANRLVCRCGTTLAGRAYTLGYRLGAVSAAGRADLLAQHRRTVAGLCAYCGHSACSCHMTIGS